MSAGGEAVALDAAAVVDEGKAEKKRLAAVAYYERELAAAVEAVERLAGKAGRLREQADDADAAHAEAVEQVQVARERYEAAQAEVS